MQSPTSLALQYFLYLPTDVVKDSAFPFKAGEDVAVVVDAQNQHLIIKKLQRGRKRPQKLAANHNCLPASYENLAVGCN